MVLNSKKQAFSVVGGVLLAALLAGCSKSKDPQTYLQAGKVLLQQGDDVHALIQFKNALQINPKLAEGYYNLALIEEKRQNWQAMYGNLLETVKLEPNHLEAHYKLGLIYLAGEAFDKASNEAALIEKLQPGHADALTLRGKMLYLQGKKDEGTQLVRQAIEQEPSNYDIATILVSMYLNDGRYAEALAELNQIIEKHPKIIGLRLLKIQAEADGKDPEAAIADYQALIAQNPDQRELSDGLMALLVKLGRHQQAEAMLRKMIDANPADTNAKLMLVGLIGQRDEAEGGKALAQFAAENPKNIPLNSQLADYYASRQRYAEAQAILKHIIEVDRNGRGGLAAKVSLAKIAIVEKDSKTAQSLLDSVIAADATHPDALMFRAALRLENHNPDGAIVDLQAAVKANPKLDQAMVMLARAYQINGNAEIADNTLRQALEVNPGNLDAALPVAARMIMAKDVDRAEGVINAALKAHPDDPLALQMLTQVRVLKSDWTGAQSLAAQLGQQYKESSVGQYISGEIFALQGNYAEAIKKHQMALQERPDFPEAIRALAQAYDAKGERAQLKAYFQAFIEKNPKVIEAYGVLAYAYATDKEWNDALKVAQNALRINPKAPAAYEALAGVYQVQGKRTEAIDVYRKGMAELPDDLTLQVRLAEAYEAVKDSEAAIALYRQILQKAPKLDVALNNLASVLADYRTDKESLQQAVKLAAGFAVASNPYQLDTYGWVALKTGEASKALPVLQQVVSAAPEVAIFRYHLGEAYYLSSDLASAQKELERALELAKKQGEFVGIEQARNRLKELAQAPAKGKSQ